MIQHCPSGAGLLRPRIFLFLPNEVLYMFVFKDALRFAALCTLASMSFFLMFVFIVWIVEFIRNLID